MSVTLEAPVFFELEVKKSRFLAWVEPVADMPEAKARIQQLRQQYGDARHVCFAFYVHGNSGMSDDGEPSGTAGKPIFNVINHKHLINVVAVVVRYFGGVKLGAGGLSRAYGGAVSQALELAVYQPVEVMHKLTLRFPFALESDIRRVSAGIGLDITDVVYQDNVTATIMVKTSQLATAQRVLQAVAPGNPDLVVQLED